jgi:hypothetical protein
LKVDVNMEIGSVSDTVVVTGEVALIENANASNGQVLDTQKMTDLPNLGRNPFLLSKCGERQPGALHQLEVGRIVSR